MGVFRTGPWLLELTAREFFDRVVREQLDAHGMVEGPNFAFGHDRKGDVRTLGTWCSEAGIEFEVVDLAEIDGRFISSSLIRQSLRDGDVAVAAQYLGRPHRIRGVVTAGAGRGATIGFPTINLDKADTLVPAEGVYAALARMPGDERAHPAACNIGSSPTFGELSRKIEAHLIGFSGDLYGKRVELDFLERLRPTRKFSGREELMVQIAADVEVAERICRSSP